MAAALEDELPQPGRAACSRAPGPSGIDRVDGGRRRCAATTAARSQGTPRAAGHRLDPQQRGPAASTPPGVEVDEGGYVPVDQTAAPTSPTSTPPATCRGSCRCRRWPPCRAARSPSTPWACTPASSRQLDYDKAASAIFTDPGDRRRRPGRGRRLRRGPQGPGHQGAVLGLAQGAHREPQPRLREDRQRPGHRRGAGRLDRRPPRRRADLGDRRRGHQRPARSPTSSTASSSTRRCPRRWPRRRSSPMPALVAPALVAAPCWRWPAPRRCSIPR